MEPVRWSDQVDQIIGGDLTAALAYVTPAGGAVVTAVAPIGLRDREHGTVAFTTSLGFGRKLERIKRNPRVALAYHAREHGFASGSQFVLVQGAATVTTEPDRDYLENVVQPSSERFLGPPKRGKLFWDRWLDAYYNDRVPVDVMVERVTSWPGERCAGEPRVDGAQPAGPPSAQPMPKKGGGPRIDVERAARRLGSLDHLLLAFVGGDGFPAVLPVEVAGTDPAGIRLVSSVSLPPGARRAGLLAHSYRAQLVGLAARQHTGWLTVDEDRRGALYAPHTEAGFRAPANKTVLALANGLLARRGLRRARKAAAVND